MFPLILPLLGFETIAAIVTIAVITGKKLRRRYPNIVLNRAFAQYHSIFAIRILFYNFLDLNDFRWKIKIKVLIKTLCS